MRLLETIKVKNRKLLNVELHTCRMNESRRKLWGVHQTINLESVVQIPDMLTPQTYKCRIIYDTKIHNIEFVHYTPKTIQTLKIIHIEDLDYTFKYENRVALENLVKQKGHCDDVLIVKNNLVTDTSYANIVFWDGSHWITPKNPLLRGTQRTLLLKQKQILSQNIRVSDLKDYACAKLINAMLEFNATPFDVRYIYE